MASKAETLKGELKKLGEQKQEKRRELEEISATFFKKSQEYGMALRDEHAERSKAAKAKKTIADKKSETNKPKK